MNASMGATREALRSRNAHAAVGGWLLAVRPVLKMVYKTPQRQFSPSRASARRRAPQSPLPLRSRLMKNVMDVKTTA